MTFYWVLIASFIMLPIYCILQNAQFYLFYLLTSLLLKHDKFCTKKKKNPKSKIEINFVLKNKNKKITQTMANTQADRK